MQFNSYSYHCTRHNHNVVRPEFCYNTISTVLDLEMF